MILKVSSNPDNSKMMCSAAEEPRPWLGWWWDLSGGGSGAELLPMSQEEVLGCSSSAA